MNENTPTYSKSSFALVRDSFTIAIQYTYRRKKYNTRI